MHPQSVSQPGVRPVGSRKGGPGLEPEHGSQQLLRAHNSQRPFTTRGIPGAPGHPAHQQNLNPRFTNAKRASTTSWGTARVSGGQRRLWKVMRELGGLEHIRASFLNQPVKTAARFTAGHALGRTHPTNPAWKR